MTEKSNLAAELEFTKSLATEAAQVCAAALPSCDAAREGKSELRHRPGPRPGDDDPRASGGPVS